MALVDGPRRGRFEFLPGGVPLDRTIDTPLSILLVERANRANGAPSPAPPAKKSRMKELLESRAGE
jgi:hypothetical protein